MERYSELETTRRDIPSFIEPRPPLISNPFMRPRPQKGTNLLEMFEEDAESVISEEPELVQVYLRLKPSNVVNNLYEVRSNQSLITSVDTATAGHGRRTQHNVSKMYTFSHIFGAEADQKEIFEHVVKDNLKRLPDGHNFTLLTYGASGSGKTYTLMGTVASPGLVPRSLEYVFRVVDAAQQPLYKPADNGAEKLSYNQQEHELQWVKKLRQVSAPLRDKYRRMSAQLCNEFSASTYDLSNRTRYYVWVSFLEIYNEALYDLLVPSDRKSASKLRIREDANGNVYVKGATQAFVRSSVEAYDVMVAGKHNLQVAATGVHAHSSRSHCIFTITMLTETDGGVRSSCVRLCDLAGSERARRTRNTGARLQESRAINSSLHVLERCLHMLRRKQAHRHDTLVPYRESKLTRLLGAGLSGARGEAVSMVVTLNPSPDYVHETRHVLQLAAVARDIQVNHTIAESTLEMSQDTSACSGAELMKLRADNERLHYELVRAQSHNQELMAAMEEEQQKSATIMKECVAEAKDLTEEYYKAQMEAMKETHRLEMEELIESYEKKLRETTRLSINGAGSPSVSLHTKITKLMTEIAILKEQVNSERLARARAEEEVQHLRACIEERDDNSDESIHAPPEEDLQDSDSENESDNETVDPLNESLEPSFKKEDINRSRMLIQSLQNESRLSSNHDNTPESIVQENSVLENSADTLKDITVDDEAKDSGLADNEATEHSNDVTDTNLEESLKEEPVTVKKPSLRETYFISNEKVDIKDDTKDDLINIDKIKAKFKGPYCLTDSGSKDLSKETIQDAVPADVSTQAYRDINEKPSQNNVTPDHIANALSDTFIEKLTKVTKTSDGSDSSLLHFEQIEKVAQHYDKSNTGTPDDISKNTKSKLRYFDSTETEPEANTEANKNNVKIEKIPYEFANIKMIKEKRTYFEDIKVKPNVPVKNPITSTLNQDIIDDLRSPSIIKDDVPKDYEPSKITKLLGESFTKKTEIKSLIHKTKVAEKKDSLDVFEAADSPQIVKTNETKVIEPCETKIDTIEQTRKSVAELKIEKQEIKTENSVDSYVTMPEVSTDNVNEIEPAKSNPSLISFVKPKPVQKTMSIDLFGDSPQLLKAKDDDSPVTSIINIDKKLPIEGTIKQEVKPEFALSVIEEKKTPDNTIQSVNDNVEPEHNNTTVQSENTIDEFENIYKDITAPRATEFELLVSRDNSIAHDEAKDGKTNVDDKKVTLKYNLREKSNVSPKEPSKSRVKTKSETEDTKGKFNVKEEILMESQEKCESSVKPKRTLRLRRRKNQEETEKLKDIVNLQKEFSDVTLDVPAPKKDVKDIPSPEKVAGEENRPPPILGIQSCPSKSVTRSRRKLFTPRAEPLEEDDAPGDSGERLYVPRPSYHRTRARRRLNAD